MTSIEVVHPDEITESMRARWQALQAAERDLASPFFSAEFCRIVGRVRDDVRVGIVRRDGEIAAFFPFHKGPLGVGSPLAGQISDYHGIIGDPTQVPDQQDLLRAFGIVCYDFDHVPRSQGLFSQSAFRETASRVIDISHGFDAWVAGRKRTTSALGNVERRRRKIAREVGVLEFRAHDPSEDALQFLLENKRKALARLGVPLVLDLPWVASLLSEVCAENGPEFAGTLSTLRAGDTLVAAHFGMRSSRAWHWWFPTYDAAYEAYAPGLILLYESARCAAEMGLTEVDLGRGDARYKLEFASATRPLVEGSIERMRFPLGAVRRVHKSVQRAGHRLLPKRFADLNRRAGKRLIGAGILK